MTGKRHSAATRALISVAANKQKLPILPNALTIRQIEWFLEKITISSEWCWNHSSGGVNLRWGIRPAYQVMWFLVTGHWPTQFVCHACDNPCCVNPSHLWEGDAKANNEDAATKGHKAKKFSKQCILEIRARRANGETLTSIAAAFHTSPTTISHVARRKTWKHF